MFSPHGTFSPIQVIIPFLVLSVCLSFWGWMYRDMVTNNDLPDDSKHNWTLAFVVFNIFAAVIYYNAVYRHRR
jgi:hypothetical protein